MLVLFSALSGPVIASLGEERVLLPLPSLVQESSAIFDCGIPWRFVFHWLLPNTVVLARIRKRFAFL